MNRTEEIIKVLKCIDAGRIAEAVVLFCNDLDHEERDFIFTLLQELRALRKQQT